MSTGAAAADRPVSSGSFNDGMAAMQHSIAALQKHMDDQEVRYQKALEQGLAANAKEHKKALADQEQRIYTKLGKGKHFKAH